MLTNREVILAKVETTYNTDPTPVVTDDAVLVEGPSWSDSGLRMVERPSVTANLDTKQQIYAGALKQVTFDVELKGAGSAYSATNYPEVSALLRACGYAETIVTTSSSETVTYAPASSSLESCTIYYYQDGTRHILTGCRGNVTFTLEAGSYGKASFTMTGHFSTTTDTALPSPTYLSTVPPAVINGAFTIDSYAAVIASMAFDAGNTIATPPDFNAADGFAQIYLTKRNITGSFDPEAVLVATEAFEANFRAGTAMALATGDIGSTQYNQYNVTMPAVYYQSIGPGDRDGVRVFDLGFGAGISSGDDEVSIVFD